MTYPLLEYPETLRDLDHVEQLMDALPQLMTNRNCDRYASAVQQGVYAVQRAIAADRPFTGIDPGELATVVDSIDLDEPLVGTAEALRELEAVYLKDAVYFHHPRYAAHLNCPVVIPALLGETVLTAINSSLDTWDQSAGATLIERRLIAWTANRLGLGTQADGVFTSGGSQSNLQALLIARNHAQQGGAPLDSLRIFASDAAHFSVQKSAALLGLGEGAVVVIPTDGKRRLRIDALEAAIDAAKCDGKVPMAVVATAGTTDFGSIDPLPEAAGTCQRHNVWLHVDAAYGGGLMTSLRHGHLLNGIEYADSVTVDYHKTFFQPVSSSAVLVKDPAMFGHVTHYADYLNPRGETQPNQVNKSLQTTRRFDALKLWLTLRIMGADAIGAMLDEVVGLAAQIGAELEADPEFELAAQPQLSTVVFRYVPVRAQDANQLNKAIRRAIFASGEAVIAGTLVDGRQYLKLTLLNPDATAQDLREIINLIRRTGSALLGETDD